MTTKTKKLLLAQTKRTETCRGVPLELRYYRICEEAPDGTMRYGAAVEAVRDGEQTRAEICDITTSKADYDRLLAALARGMVTPESLREVVEDWL